MDRAVHVIVLTGAGDRFFCAGANIGMLKEADPEFKYYFCLHANETLNRLEQTPKLVIAALNGHTVGGGLEVAMAADIRIARKDAGKIGLPEVALGVLPGTGGTQRLARLVGKSPELPRLGKGYIERRALPIELAILYSGIGGPSHIRFSEVRGFLRDGNRLGRRHGRRTALAAPERENERSQRKSALTVHLTRIRSATAGGVAHPCGLKVEFHGKRGAEAASRSLHRLVRCPACSRLPQLP
jgi:hypothetical protein